MTFQFDQRPNLAWSSSRYFTRRTAHGWAVYDSVSGERIGWYRHQRSAIRRSRMEQELLKIEKCRLLESGKLVKTSFGMAVDNRIRE